MIFSGVYSRNILLHSLILSVFLNLLTFIYYHDQFASSPEYLKQRSIKSMDVYEYEHKVHDVSPKVRNFQKRRKAYLLITLYRSGSTLTGEMFNRNKKFLYYFEPLAIFGNNEATRQKIQMLNESFNCIPPVAEKFKENAPTEASTTKNCLNEGICMFQLSTRFCKPPFCWKKDAPATQCKKQCESPGKQPAKYDYIQKVCQSEVDTVAIKTIRFLELKKLKPFYDDSYPMKFRVVMLVRDPRSMYHSRKKIFLNLENGNGKQMGGFMKVLKNECQAMAENFLSLEASNDISRKTYTLRYEDIALDPMKYAKRIYNFIGEDFDDEIQKMLNDAVAPPENQMLDKSKATYTTKRAINETQILNSWRLDKYVSNAELKEIEKGCGEMMRIFGYLPLGNQPRANLQIPTVEKNYKIFGL